MRIIIIALIFFTVTNLHSQDSCVVKVFPGDCLNCYVGMNKVEFTGQNIKKTIVFPKLSDAEVKAYIKDVLNVSDISKFSVIVSDSIYNSMNNRHSSEVYVYNDNKLSNHSLLKKFYGFEEFGPFEIKIPDSIALSIASTIINNENYFFITDPKFGKIVFVNKHGDHKITIIETTDLTTESNFELISGDTMCFHMFKKYREVLENVNMDRMKLKHTFGIRDKMTSFLLAPDIIIGDNGPRLNYITSVIQYSNPKEYIIFGILEESLPSNYVVYPGYFSEYNSEYYMQLVNTDRAENDQYMLGKFVLSNGNLEFTGFAEYKLPREYLPAIKFKGLRKILTPADPYIFLQYSLTFYNMDNNKTYHLPFDSVDLKFEMPGQSLNLLRFEHSYKFFDAHISNNIVQVLFEQSGKHFIAILNREDTSLINKYEISDLKKPIKAGMRFYSKDKLFYLTDDNTIVVENIIHK